METITAPETIRLPLPLAGVDPDDWETWIELPLCESKDHGPRLAVRRAYPGQGPICYCEACAIRARAVYAALGAHLHEDDLPILTIAATIETVRRRLSGDSYGDHS